MFGPDQHEVAHADPEAAAPEGLAEARVAFRPPGSRNVNVRDRGGVLRPDIAGLGQEEAPGR